MEPMALARPSFVLIPGAGGAAWYWSRLVPLLQEHGHEAVAVDLPGDDPGAGLDVYADRVVEAIGERTGVILVAQSMGGFTAPLVCARVAVSALILVNAMIPLPGETAGAWWGNTGWEQARVEAAKRDGRDPTFDVNTYFLHDVPPEVANEGAAHQWPEAEIAFKQPCRFEAWPKVPIHAVAGTADRFFPIEFQRRIARERLGLVLDELPGGHLITLSNPRGLADYVLARVPRG